MRVLLRACLTLAVSLVLAGCGEIPARYLLDPTSSDTTIRLRVAAVELREVSLPSYAADSEIVVQQPDGSLGPVANAVWADDPVRAVTLALAGNLDTLTTASVAAEPWPLEEPPDVRVEVRIDRMVARADGQFQLSGLFAIAAPEGAIRESIDRFDIRQPIPDTAPQAVAQATSAALFTLSERIAGRLKR